MSTRMEATVILSDPLADDAWERTQALFEKKIILERHAFDSDGIGIRRDGDKIVMYGLASEEENYRNAAVQYMERILALAKESKRVNKARDSRPENEKYAFRIWLLRLGFIGPEYKASRDILLKNLSGTSSRKEAEK